MNKIKNLNQFAKNLYWRTNNGNRSNNQNEIDAVIKKQIEELKG